MNDYVVIFNAPVIDPSVFELAREFHQDIITVEHIQNAYRGCDEMRITFMYHRAFEKDSFISELKAQKDKIFYDRYTASYRI